MFEAFSVRPRCRDEQHPVSGHRKGEGHDVDARGSLGRLRDDRRHAWMRHVAFEPHFAPVTAPPAGSRSVTVKVAGPTAGGDGVSVHDRLVGVVAPAACTSQLVSAARECTHERHARAAHQARAGLTSCSAHEHCGLAVSSAGGNRW